MTKLYPLAIAAIALAFFGPMVADWVGGMTLTLAADTAATMEGLK